MTPEAPDVAEINVLLSFYREDVFWKLKGEYDPSQKKVTYSVEILPVFPTAANNWMSDVIAFAKSGQEKQTILNHEGTRLWWACVVELDEVSASLVTRTAEGSIRLPKEKLLKQPAQPQNP